MKRKPKKKAKSENIYFGRWVQIRTEFSTEMGQSVNMLPLLAIESMFVNVPDFKND